MSPRPQEAAVVPSLPASPDAASGDLYDAVSEVYEHYRTARLNLKYYGRRLAALQAWTLAIDVATALGTSGTLASLPFAAHPTGKTTLVVLATIAAVLGVLKPVLGLSKRVERVTRLWTEHNAAHNALRRAVADIRVRHAVRPEVVDVVAAAVDRVDQLATEDDLRPRRSLVERLEREVNEEIPATDLWWPTEPQSRVA